MAEEKKTEEKPLEKWTAPELREIAKEIEGVTGVHAMKKDELLRVIKKARGIPDEKPVKKKKVKTVFSIVELKKKILLMQNEKAALREAGDKKKTDVYRRRISRLKKRTRKVVKA